MPLPIITLKVTPWRYFRETFWVSLTGGFIGLILGWFFGFGFYAIALCLFCRSAIHSFIYPVRCNIEITPETITGPKVMMQSVVELRREDVEKVQVMGGRFFILDRGGREISGRFAWYDLEGPKILRSQISTLTASFH